MNLANLAIVAICVNYVKVDIMTKKTKTTKKATKKPEILINCTDCETSSDVYVNYIYAKARANKAITEDEIDWLVTYRVLDAVNICAEMTVAACMACSGAFTPKKQPWYKRAWKKIKGIFTRK